VGRPDARFPDGGLPWEYTPPCVALEWWPVREAPRDAPFTTLSNWRTSKEWFTFGEASFANDKRSGFFPFLELPRLTDAPLELASGKPAVVEHTGPSGILPEGEGIFRFRTLDEAVRALDTVAADYERQSRLARALAAEVFAADVVVPRLLERALA